MKKDHPLRVALKKRPVQLVLAATAGFSAAYLYFIKYQESLGITAKQAELMQDHRASWHYDTRYGEFVLIPWPPAENE